jgi:hypothetical protein
MDLKGRPQFQHGCQTTREWRSVGRAYTRRLAASNLAIGVGLFVAVIAAYLAFWSNDGLSRLRIVKAQIDNSGLEAMIADEAGTARFWLEVADTGRPTCANSWSECLAETDPVNIVVGLATRCAKVAPDEILANDNGSHRANPELNALDRACRTLKAAAEDLALATVASHEDLDRRGQEQLRQAIKAAKAQLKVTEKS